MLRIENISKHFSGVQALDQCSFQVEAGSITGIIGPNGAGKTTLLNMIAGFLKPTAGSIILRDQDVTGFSPHRLVDRGLVRTFQIPQELGQMTVLENLMLVPSGQQGENLLTAWLHWRKIARQEQLIQQQAETVLDCLNLSHLRDELAQNISGGQKKLLEMGRTLMVRPQVILLDEPSAGVNRTLLRRLTEVIRQLNQEQGCTICLIEHDLDLVDRLCDRIIVLDQGKVLAAGTMAEIRQHPQVQKAYLGHGGP